MTLDFTSLALGLILGLAAACLFLIPRLTVLRERLRQQEEAQKAMADAFSLAAQEALNKSSEQFLNLAKEKLHQAQADGSHDLEKRQKAIFDMVTPIQKNLEQLGTAVEQIKGTDQALREDLQLLNRETARLVGALKDPAGQGRWGEFILEGLLEKSGLLKGIHYETQVSLQTESGRQRPDVVINLHDGFHIVIDAKAPINEFADRMSDSMTSEEREELSRNLARQVREHIRALGRKGYWEKMDSPDFTVLFLPGEHIFSMALRTDPDLIDYASAQNVVIASPTLLLSLLRVVALSWRQAELAKNAQEISARGSELYQRLAIFAGHFEKIGKGILGAMNSYNDAIGSLERSVLPSARKLKELQVQTANKDIAEPVPIDTMPRAISSPELLDGENNDDAEGDEKKIHA